MPRLADVDRVTGEVRRRGPTTPVRYERERPVSWSTRTSRRWPASRTGRPPHAGARLRPAPRLRPLLPARRRRRLQPRRLRGAAARRARGHLRGVHEPRAALLRRAGPDRRAGDDRQRPGLPQRRVQRAAGGRRRTAHIHEALQPVAERQGGADEPHRRAEVAIRPGLDGEAERASALPAFIERYNRERPHSACRGLPPMSRIVGVNNLSARNI